MLKDDIIVEKFFFKKKKEIDSNNFYSEIKELILSRLKAEVSDIPTNDSKLLNPFIKNLREEKDFYIIGFEGIIHALILEIIRNNNVKEKDFLYLKKFLISHINNNRLEDIDSILFFELRSYDYIEDKKLIDKLIHYYVVSKLKDSSKLYNINLEEKLYEYYGDMYTRINEVVLHLSI